MSEFCYATRIAAEASFFAAGEKGHQTKDGKEAVPLDGSALSGDSDIGNPTSSQEDSALTEQAAQAAVESTSGAPDDEEGEPQFKRPHRSSEVDPREMKLKAKPHMLERKYCCIPTCFHRSRQDSDSIAKG